jgi:hypothetical protein
MISGQFPKHQWRRNPDGQTYARACPRYDACKTTAYAKIAPVDCLASVRLLALVPLLRDYLAFCAHNATPDGAKSKGIGPRRIVWYTSFHVTLCACSVDDDRVCYVGAPIFPRARRFQGRIPPRGRAGRCCGRYLPNLPFFGIMG